MVACSSVLVVRKGQVKVIKDRCGRSKVWYSMWDGGKVEVGWHWGGRDTGIGRWWRVIVRVVEEWCELVVVEVITRAGWYGATE